MDELYYHLGRFLFIVLCLTFAGGIFEFGKALARKLFDLE